MFMSTTLPILAISLLVPIVIVVVVLRGSGTLGPKKRVLRTGTPGQAVIMGIAPTGTVVNNVNYLCRVQLRVSVPGRELFDVETRELLPITAMSAYPVGAVVAVKVDPKRTDRVFIDRSVAPVVTTAGTTVTPPQRPQL